MELLPERIAGEIRVGETQVSIQISVRLNVRLTTTS